MESLLGPVLEFLRGRQSSLVASLVALCVFAGHELFTVVATPCPCSPGRNPALAAVAAFGPALILLLAGLAVNNHTRRSLTGCVTNSIPIGPGLCCTLSLLALSRSLLAPIVWLIAALLRGNYYECAASEFQSGAWVFAHPNVSHLLPRESLARVPCDSLRLSAWLSPEDERQIRSDLMDKMQFESEVLGWSLLLLSSSAAFLLSLVSLCKSPVAFLQLQYWRIYTRAERDAFSAEAQAHAQHLARQNVTAFLGTTTTSTTSPGVHPSVPGDDEDDREEPGGPNPPAVPPGHRTPTEADWRWASRPFTVAADRGRWSYSALHRWAMERRGGGGGGGGGAEMVPLVADEVDSEGRALRKAAVRLNASIL